MPDNTNNDAKEEVQPADDIIYVHLFLNLSHASAIIG